MMQRSNRNRIARIAVLVLGAWGWVPLAGQTPADVITGKWSGTSICVDQRQDPNCRDEVIIYEVARIKAGVGRVMLKADKVVEGRREEMGILPFDFSMRDSSWTSEFTTRRFHGIWRIRAHGATLDGTLNELPSGRTVRRVALTRIRPGLR